MSPELKRWQCGRCGLAVDLPDHETEYDQFIDVMNRIREHRWAHLVTALESESNEEFLGVCEDKPADPLQSAYARMSRLNTSPTDTVSSSTEPVSQEDVDSCIEDVMELLQDDLPRAKRLWYPINPDGSFNREEGN